MYNSIIKLREIIKVSGDKIKTIQDNCKHISKTTEYKGNTGNYDPSDDCYWKELYCPDCDKHWREDK